MPGRGRGSFGTKFSFDIAALGFGGKFGLNQLTSAAAPPSSFPPLDAQPAKLIADDEHEYLVELSRNFHSLANDSPFYLRGLKMPKPFIERYADIVEREGAKTPKNNKWPPIDQWPIDWDRFPMELRPPSMRTSQQTVTINTPSSTKIAEKPAEKTPKKRPKKSAKGSSKDDDEDGPIQKKKKRLRVKDEEVDDETIEKRLAALEQAEKQGGDGLLSASSIKQELIDIPEIETGQDEGEGGGGDNDEQGGEAAKKKASDEEDNNDGEDEEGEQAAQEEELDEEMGDYGDDYFDNGEAYDEEDDGDNEGPTY